MKLAWDSRAGGLAIAMPQKRFPPRDCRRARTAFTLMEVMVATAIFFICVFAILGLVTNSLRNAKVIQQHSADLGMVAAMASMTNKLTDGSMEQGDFEDIAPGSFPGYTWSRECTEVASNGLFKVDVTVAHSIGGKLVESKMSLLLFRPESQRSGVGFGARLNR